VLAKSLDEANAVAERLAALPEVARTRTLSSFIPDDQDEKITAIKLATRSLGPALNPAHRQPAPRTRSTRSARRRTISQGSQATQPDPAPKPHGMFPVC
jgi:hypothetical protein